MADFVFNQGKFRFLATSTGRIDWEADTIQALLVSTTYEAISQATLVDKDFVDDGSADDPASHEISVTGYTPGFSGSGRKTLASKTTTESDANDRAELDAADVTWTALGSGATIGGVVVYKRGSADTDSRLISFHDVANTATNGGDISISWNSAGVITLT
jgi:hypothetical protein